MRLRFFFRTIAQCLAGVLFVYSLVQTQASPSIIITNLPVYGTFGNLSGYVTNANSTTNSIAAFVFVGGGWYSKPYCSPQISPIQTNGAWSVNITTFSSDTNATEIAVFLVPTNYNQPCVNGAPGLTNLAQVEATVYAVRVNPGARQFNFSGYGWWCKAGPGLQGPGPNYFTDSTNNVGGWAGISASQNHLCQQSMAVCGDHK